MGIGCLRTYTALFYCTITVTYYSYYATNSPALLLLTSHEIVTKTTRTFSLYITIC